MTDSTEPLPRNANGKIDRKSLPVPEYVGQTEQYVPPRNSTEEQLAAIWAKVLRLEKVGAHDEFFALGGHSLLATQVVSRVRQSFGVELPLRALFEESAQIHRGGNTAGKRRKKSILGGR